ncbi:cyclic GMP-AMP synthase-like receptor [Anabrus simplex]|uniref:cyclic GMP-AMP synthase-like receptor n=1 Tax=Anabrus simplex TaxID=316456 RepID=UPI0035A283A1
MAALNTRDYHRLDSVLREITSSSISLKGDEIRAYNKHLTEILKLKMIPAMENVDPLFKCLYKRLMYSGSYYENLKISKPNEFDLNMELEIPASDIQVLTTRHNGFVQVKVNQFDPNKLKRCLRNYADGEKRLKRWLDDGGLLKREHVLKWMQGVVDKALQTFQINDIMIRRSTSGPAITLNITSRVPGTGRVEFSIDLVPVFIFGTEHWPKPPVRRPVYPSLVTWCVVPKAPGYVPPETHWRISFYDQERRMMTGYGAMKHIIKLMKLLRDCQKWDCLSSYYIKTVFLWEMEKTDRQFWQQSIGFLFVHMLKRFVYHLKEMKSIPFYWDSRHSLISGLRPDTIINIGNRIDQVVRNIERNLPDNPDVVKIYFPGHNRQVAAVNQSLLSGLIESLASTNHPQQGQRQEGLGVWATVGIGAAVGIAALGAGLLFNLGRRQANN